MKTITIAALFALAPSAATAAVCNADNVLRALRGHSAQASPFCSTYTRPPPNQPLPTYVSTYPASRVSSACSCLLTTSSSTSTTSSTKTSSTTSSSKTSTSTTASVTPTPTPYYCETDAITNGDFKLLANGKPDPWILAPATSNSNGQSTSTGYGDGYA